MARVRIGELLMRQGRLDELQLQSALAHQARWGGRLGRAVVHLGFLDEASFLEVLAEQLGTPFVTVGDRTVDAAVLALVPRKLILGRKVLPLARLTEGRRGPLVVALADPGDLGVLDEISFATGLDVRPALATEADLDQAIARLLGTSGGAPRRLAPLDLPEDTNPLSAASQPGKRVLN
ncbi:MAG: general secretion pathway protein GspE [Anaeromyxobacteraceae bacterium]|nr:general secretion pathway protein GspE [Anaeromyxobacteraceae bacterium]